MAGQCAAESASPMSKRQLLISGAVAVACGAILVIFTDIEDGFVRWVNCGPLGGPQEHHSEICR